MMSREVTVQPLHLTPIGKEKVPTPADKIFMSIVQCKDNSVCLYTTWVGSWQYVYMSKTAIK